MQNESGIWSSWNENIEHPYSNIINISNEAELVDAISNAKKIRVFGSKQSSADIAAGTETLIDVSNYNQILNIDESKQQVTVQSGVILKDLIEFIEQKGLCIPCLPDINTITIGGAISTGTHGTNGHLLSEYISNCKLVLADGLVLQVSSADDLMDAIRVSIGTLGVFSEITFQCEPLYTLHLKEGPEHDEDWISNLKTKLTQYDFLRILWLPHTGNGYVIKGKKVPEDYEIHEKAGPSYLKHRRTVSKILYKYTHRFPWFTATANKILYRAFFSSRKEHKGTLYQATVTKSRGATLELAEWTIPLKKFEVVFNELKAEFNKKGNKTFIHIPMDVRFVMKDQAWLSYAYNEDIVTMGCVSRNAATADEYEAFKTVESIFIKHGGKPHWAKRFEAKDEALKELYPKWEDFKNLRKEMDPTNKFLNKYLSEIFNEQI